jgi:hypothetical protein
MFDRLAVTQPRRVIDLRGAALTPRGTAVVALHRFLVVWEDLDQVDRAYLVPTLRELVDGAPAPRPGVVGMGPGFSAVRKNPAVRSQGGSMADRRVPGQLLGPFLDGLLPSRLRTLLDLVGAGLFHAQAASQCLTDPGHRHRETAPQFLAYLSSAIAELELARAIVAEAAEGGGGG